MDTFLRLANFNASAATSYVFFYSPGQSTDGWNGYCFRNLYNGIEIPGTRDGETGFDDVYTQFLELPGNFYLFDCIQLTPRNLLCIPKGGIEYITFSRMR